MDSVAIVGQLAVVDDISPAEWLGTRLHVEPPDTCSTVPTGFESYARIFHPAYEYNIQTGEMARRLSWSDIADETGRIAHPLMQWEKIRPSRTVYQEPTIGTVSRDLAQSLAPLLGRHTEAAATCWFGAWVGRQPLRVPAEAPVFRLPLRDMYLLYGSVTGLSQNLAPAPLSSLPNIAWPNDCRWVIATDADLRSTYLAASTKCIQDLLAVDDIEAFEVNPTDLVTLASDTVNSAGR